MSATGKRYGLKLPLLARSDDFDKCFKKNAQKGKFYATAKLDGVTLSITSQNWDHYSRSLAYWEKIHATNITMSETPLTSGK